MYGVVKRFRANAKHSRQTGNSRSATLKVFKQTFTEDGYASMTVLFE